MTLAFGRAATRTTRSRGAAPDVDGATRPAMPPPLSPRLGFARGVIVAAVVLGGTLLLHIILVSRLQQAAAQQQAFDRIRGELANGTAPTGTADESGHPLAAGTPVAVLEIPSIHLKQVILEGTNAGTLFDGPGHRRDTPLPGQVGVSVVMGRKAAYGGPFSRLPEVAAGDEITVTTGQGTFLYRALGVRREGDPLPPALTSGSSRLTLATAAGARFVPDGILRVDADLEGDAVGGSARLAAASLPGAERAMAGDMSTLWALALWLQGLVVLASIAVWSWHRWGRSQTWVVFVPPLLLVGFSASGEVARLLPNLM